MDWPSVLGAAVSGALAGAFVSIVLRNKTIGRAAQAVVFAVAFVGFNTVAREFVIPAYRAYALEKSVLDLPAYREIAIADPQAYGRITAALKGGVTNRGTLPQA